MTTDRTAMGDAMRAAAELLLEAFPEDQRPTGLVLSVVPSINRVALLPVWGDDVATSMEEATSDVDPVLAMGVQHHAVPSTVDGEDTPAQYVHSALRVQSGVIPAGQPVALVCALGPEAP